MSSKFRHSKDRPDSHFKIPEHALSRRLIEHYKNRGKPDTFAGKYYCYNLVYYEWYQYINNALTREKEIKKLLRASKNAIVEEANPEWKFFNAFICGAWPPKEINIEK